MSDTELQLALAKMLPEKLELRYEQGFEEETGTHYNIGLPFVCWVLCEQDSGKVRDTEWLHICWLVEQSLSPMDYSDFLRAFEKTNGYGLRIKMSASWQQRAEALCKVKGIQ